MHRERLGASSQFGYLELHLEHLTGTLLVLAPRQVQAALNPFGGLPALGYDSTAGRPRRLQLPRVYRFFVVVFSADNGSANDPTLAACGEIMGPSVKPPPLSNCRSASLSTHQTAPITPLSHPNPLPTGEALNNMYFHGTMSTRPTAY
jgi:hypothetical protein